MGIPWVLTTCFHPWVQDMLWQFFNLLTSSTWSPCLFMERFFYAMEQWSMDKSLACCLGSYIYIDMYIYIYIYYYIYIIIYIYIYIYYIQLYTYICVCVCIQGHSSSVAHTLSRPRLGSLENQSSSSRFFLRTSDSSHVTVGHIWCDGSYWADLQLYGMVTSIPRIIFPMLDSDL